MFLVLSCASIYQKVKQETLEPIRRQRFEVMMSVSLDTFVRKRLYHLGNMFMRYIKVRDLRYRFLLRRVEIFNYDLIRFYVTPLSDTPLPATMYHVWQIVNVNFNQTFCNGNCHNKNREMRELYVEYNSANRLCYFSLEHIYGNLISPNRKNLTSPHSEVLRRSSRTKRIPKPVFIVRSYFTNILESKIS